MKFIGLKVEPEKRPVRQSDPKPTKRKTEAKPEAEK